MKRIHADTVHPICIFIFFAGVLGFTLACSHPVIGGVSLVCACAYLVCLRGLGRLRRHLKFALPLMIIVAVANPLFNHRGKTLLFIMFDQWFTLEAVAYGVVAGVQLGAVILWFACYQIVMTSDKFLYLFGKAAPSAALLITMTLRLIPGLQSQLEQIKTAHRMLEPKPERLAQKMHVAIRRLSTLLSWSMENAVEMADSMKARGYGVRRRTTFHLFRFDSRDTVILSVLLLLCGVCLLGRAFGHGDMRFFPSMSAVFTGESGMVTYGAFTLFGLLPTIFEISENLRLAAYTRQAGSAAMSRYSA